MDQLNPKMIEQLFEILDSIMKAEGAYQEKRDKIRDAGNPDDITNLMEFVAWFEEENGEGEEDEDEDNDSD